MKYLVMILSNAGFQERWAALSEAQRAEFGVAHLRLSAELAEAGELVASEGLADPALGKRVRVAGGRAVTSDGPFAEAKEHLAGFLLVDCADEDRALEIAARVPDAVWGLVEVRPVLDFSSWDG